MPADKIRIAAVVFYASEGAHADTLLKDVADGLKSGGARLAGAVQHNTHNGDRCRCDMTLEDLTSGRLVKISEDRGPEARGCRLDSSALEEIVGLVSASLEASPDIVIINKFGKREAEGSGFRSTIEQALEAGIPVVVAVNAANIDAWNFFTGGLDVRLPPDRKAIGAWCVEPDQYHGTQAAATV